MSIKNAMRTALWTEIREALISDGFVLPLTCPPHLERVIKSNADYMAELSENTDEPKETPDANL